MQGSEMQFMHALPEVAAGFALLVGALVVLGGVIEFLGRVVPPLFRRLTGRRS
ncbi:MAG: hypothetical protein AB7E32_16900 [Desulfovibrio sp.]